MDFSRIASGLTARLEPLVGLSMGLGRDSMAIETLLEGPGVLALGDLYRLADLDFVAFSDTGIEWDHTYALIEVVTAACDRAGVPFFVLRKPPRAQQDAWAKRWFKGIRQRPPWRKARYFADPEHPTLAEVRRKATLGGYHEYIDLDLSEGLYGRVTGKNTATCTERHKIIPIEELMSDLLLARYGISLSQWGAKAALGQAQPNLLMIGIAADEERRQRAWRPQDVTPNKVRRAFEAKRSQLLLTWAVRKVYPLVEMGITKADEQEILDGAGLPFVFKSGCFSCHFQPNAWFWSLRILEPERFKRVVAYEAKAIARQRREAEGRFRIRGVVDGRRKTLRTVPARSAAQAALSITSADHAAASDIEVGPVPIYTLQGEDLLGKGRALPELIDDWNRRHFGLSAQVRKGNVSPELMAAIRRRVDPAWPGTGHRLAPADLPKDLRIRLAREILGKGYNRSCAAMDRNVRGDA